MLRRPPRRPARRPQLGFQRRSWGGTTSSVTFPDTLLAIRTRVALDADLTADPATWAWRDISDDVRYELGVGITAGRADESNVVTQSSLRLMLDNREGKYSRRNPTSPYYGHLSMNTPIWVELDPGDGWKTRFTGFVNEWPTRWRGKGADSFVPIVAGGMLRRLGQTPGESWSALKRTVLASDPVAYWPMEDASGSTRAASAISAVSSMRVTTGTVDFGTVTDLGGASQSPTITNGTLSGNVPSGTGATSWYVEFAIKMPFATASVASVRTGSQTHALFSFLPPIDASDAVKIAIIDANDGVTALLNGSVVGASFENDWHQFGMTAEQSGGNIVTKLYVNGILEDTDTTAGTLSRVISCKANPYAEGVTSMGHYVVGGGLAFSGLVDAIDGYTGEQAHVRIARLCEEEAVRFTESGSVTTSEPMGPQRTNTLVPLLRECETADMGTLFEHDFGLAFQSRMERYNRVVGMTLNVPSGQLSDEPEPADDDQRVRNRWTVQRSDGSSATFEETDGPLGTVAIDVWPDSVTANVATDDQLDEQAAWRTHLTTVDEDRWPKLEFALHHDPDLIGPWTSLGYGGRIQVTDPLDEGSPDTIDAFVEGYAERFDQFEWHVTTSTSPASPFNVGVYGSREDPNGDGPDRYDTAGSETAAQFVVGTDTSMSVATTLGQIWTTDADDLPFNIRVAGVILEVTAISGGSSPQTFTVSQAPINGVEKTIAAGEALSLAEPAYYAL